MYRSWGFYIEILEVNIESPEVNIEIVEIIDVNVEIINFNLSKVMEPPNIIGFFEIKD